MTTDIVSNVVIISMNQTFVQTANVVILASTKAEGVSYILTSVQTKICCQGYLQVSIMPLGARK